MVLTQHATKLNEAVFLNAGKEEYNMNLLKAVLHAAVIKIKLVLVKAKIVALSVLIKLKQKLKDLLGR